jgi:hypothetical protein
MRVGQKVDVHFTNHQSLFDMEILYCPCATGDSWILRGSNGREYHVMMFAYMEERADRQRQDTYKKSKVQGNAEGGGK